MAALPALFPVHVPRADPGVVLPQKEEVFTSLHGTFERRLDATLDDASLLTHENILKECERYVILQENNTRVIDISVLPPRRPKKIYGERMSGPALLLKALLSLGKDSVVKRDASEFFVGRANFENAEFRTMERVFSSQDAGMLFMHFKRPHEHRLTFSKGMYRVAMGADYVRSTRGLVRKNVSKKIKARLRARIEQDYGVTFRNPKTLSDIPFGVLEREGRYIIDHFAIQRADAVTDEIIAYANIPFGAFSWFFLHRLGKDGYEGPSSAELLESALSGRLKRFSKNPSYAHIGPYLENLTIENQGDVAAFCQAITNEFAIYEFPNRSLLAGDEQSVRRYWKHRAFHLFLREYASKVYNGVMGNTPAHIILKIRTKLGERNLPMKERYLDDIFHEPFPEERLLFERMRWRGRTITR